MTVRVLLADDQALVRAGFRALLERTDDIEVVGEAQDGAQAVDLAGLRRPDVVLMDLRMPVLDGVEATRRIAADPGLGGVQVLVLTTFGDDEHLFAALRAGAAGFLTKDVEPERLRAGIRVVAAGEALLSPVETRRLIAAFAVRAGTVPADGTAAAESAGPAARPGRATLANLTPRERELVTMVAQGLSNTEIARALTLSAATVKTHVNRAMAKTGARDRAQLVVIGYESGLVTPGPA